MSRTPAPRRCSVSQAQTGPYPWYNYNATQPGGGDRFKMPETAVQGLQREMMEAAGVRRPSGDGQTKNGQNDTQSQQNANPLVQPLDRPLESPDNSPLSDRSLSTPFE